MDVAFPTDHGGVAQARGNILDAARTLRLAWAALSKLFTSCNAIAASTVPAHVRKSLAVHEAR
jgi:hypothetical protein